jgi:hypothetical protein
MWPRRERLGIPLITWTWFGGCCDSLGPYIAQPLPGGVAIEGEFCWLGRTDFFSMEGVRLRPGCGVAER